MLVPGEPVALDNTTEVETPEHVRFRYRVAGPVRRMLAYLLDLLIRIAALLVLWVIIAVAFAATKEAIQGFVLITLFVMEWGYYVFFETTGDGRSPGKRVLSLRVVKEGGYPIGFIDSGLRNLLGLRSMGADPRFRRLGDRVAGTMVVVEERGLVAAPLALTPPLAEGEL